MSYMCCYQIVLQVTTVIILSMATVMSYQLLPVTALLCAHTIPSNLAPLLDCVPKLSGTCLGEEVKCLRSNSLEPQLNNLTGSWDDSNDFFNQDLDSIRTTYKSDENTPCPWTYVAQHDSNRYPQYIYNVRCNSTRQGSYTCKPIYYTMPILMRVRCDSVTGEQQWQLNSTLVSVACVPLLE